MTTPSHPIEAIKDQPLESQQPTDASAKLSNQLSYADYKAVFPTSIKSSSDLNSLDFNSADLYKTNLPNVFANQTGDKSGTVAADKPATVASEKAATPSTSDKAAETPTKAASTPAESLTTLKQQHY